MTDTPASRHSSLVVGLVKDKDQRPDDVIRQAIVFAQKFDAELVIATVDPTHYEVRRNPDGSVVAWDIDPDLQDEEVTEQFDASFAAHVRSLLDPSGVSYSLRALAGEPAHELAKVAHELDSEAIIVGTRKQGIRTTAHEFFTGSVAVHLAHRQHRPVIVIPLNPVAHGEKLPWEDH
ncbi:universal stress protein [Gryllotalpicola reticulitermitis]|uniref:Universal stress protein n=1 Tax=Gryllotalpicola reticulitermitis TaxID=1184153 RepID=A0ABV8Q6W6_9MICO